MPRVPLARRAAGLTPAASAPPADTIAFDSGHAFPAVLPDLTREAEQALTRYRAETLQYGPRTGLAPLRRWIAERMTADGARIAPEQVLVTNGAKHALELVCRALLDEGDAVVVTAPTYFSAIPILRSFGVRFLEVPQDGEGLDVSALRDTLSRARREGLSVKFVYNVPDFHNPTGVTMSLARRRAWLDLAAELGIWVVEDSPYRSVAFDQAPPPPMVALDPAGVVLHLGTFAKLLAPGLRIGWATGPLDLVGRMALLKTDAGTSPLSQRIALEFCAGGRLPEHTTRVQRTYRDLRDRMVAAVRRELPGIALDVPGGGYYLWLTLPADVDGAELEARAREAGVSIIGGHRFFARSDAGHPANHVRLAYSHATPEEIDEGIRRLATALRPLAVGAASR